MKEHVYKIREQFRAANAAKTTAKEEDNVATIQLDWSENYNMKQAREEKGKNVCAVFEINLT